MNNTKSYYECKRCFYKCNQKNDMKRHINKKNICERNSESYKYNESELKDLSLTRIYPELESNYKCNFCNKIFSSNYTLNNHMKNICKNNSTLHGVLHDTLNNTLIDNLNDKNIINNINNVETLNNITNIINNNFDININIVKSFDEDWDTTKIDDKLKLILLLNNTKFTSTLENILQNEVNLNVIIDQTSDNGMIYENNTLKNMNIKDIVQKSMDKLYKQLCNFHNDIINPNIFNINEELLDNELKNAKIKLNMYNKEDEINIEVNKCIVDIYRKKRDITLKEIKNNIKDSY